MNSRQALRALALADPVIDGARPPHDFAASIAETTAVAEPAETASTEHVRTDGEPFTVQPAHPARRQPRSARLVTAAVLVLIVAGLGVLALTAARQDRDRVNESVAAPAEGTLGLTDGSGRLLTALRVFAGVQLDPPSLHQQPTISATAAAAVCDDPTTGCTPGTGPPHLTLAVASTDDGANIRPDGSLQRTIDNTLVWALTWNSTCVSSGGTMLQEANPSPPTPLPCLDMVLVDAATGRPLLHETGPFPG